MDISTTITRLAGAVTNKRGQEQQRPEQAEKDLGANLNNEGDRGISREQLTEAASTLAETFDLEVQLEVDEKTGRGVVKIFSANDQRLIRQIPDKAALELAYRAKNGQAEGLLDSLV